MPTPKFIRSLRAKIGNDLLQLPTVTLLIFDDEKRFLLVKTIDGDRWTVPGGFVDPGETPADAAVREAHEETGLVVELIRIIGVFGGKDCRTTFDNGDQVSWVSTLFEAKIVSGEPKADQEETSDVRFFHKTDLEPGLTSQHVWTFLEAASKGGHDCYFEPPSWSPTS